MAETASDDLPTTLAIGVTASVGQFVVHEALGHGSACLLVGGRVLAIAPLWMRCSVDHRLMVLAGPMANVVIGAVCWAVLRDSPPRTAGVRLFLWLSIAFQWLVAAGYLAVGAASGFGDWPDILPALSVWPVRVVAIAVAAVGYLISLRALARVGVQRLGASLTEESRLGRLGFFPSLAAAAVAVLAELVGGRFQLLGLALAIGCTAVVGWSLLTAPRFVSPDAPERADPRLFVQRSRAWILGGATAAVAFIVLVGPAHGS